MRVAALVAWAALATLVGVDAGHAEKRVALVIGNGDYQHADKLANPVTDARRMRDALGNLGFKIVFGEDVGKQALENAIGDFAVAAQDADVALVYFAGHGATFGDIPYVVPVDAQFSDLARMPYQLVRVETLIGELRRAKGLRIAILDACRDNAAERALKRTAERGGDQTRGLARPKNVEGIILAYATQYMATAKDGPSGGDSPFTAALLDNIATPDLDVKEMFYRVGKEVIDRTNGAQRPEISISFYDRYALVPAAAGASSQGGVQTEQALLSEQTRRDYEEAEKIGTKEAWDAYLRKYPAGFYSELARARLSRFTTIAPKSPDKIKSQFPSAQKQKPPQKKAGLEEADELTRRLRATGITLSQWCSSVRQSVRDGTGARPTGAGAKYIRQKCGSF